MLNTRTFNNVTKPIAAIIALAIIAVATWIWPPRAFALESNGNNLLKAAIAEINATNENITTTRYAYTGTGASFTAPLKGVYTLIGYGAQGGTVYGSSSREDDNAAPGGNGGYSVGNVSLGYNETIFVYVGGEGGPADATLSFENRHRSYGGAGGWNGGGRGGNGVRNTAEEINYWYSGGGGGGGATHFSSLNKQIKDFGNSSDRELILIAGGGGGACWTCEPGNGGGLEGTNSGLGITGGGTKSLGGTQTFGYSRGVGQNGANGSYRLMARNRKRAVKAAAAAAEVFGEDVPQMKQEITPTRPAAAGRGISVQESYQARVRLLVESKRETDVHTFRTTTAGI